MMILLLLLLAVPGTLGNYEELNYGDTFRIWMPLNTHSIKFYPKTNVAPKILWNRNDPSPDISSRQRVIGSYFVTHKVTAKDSGRYRLADRNQNALSSERLSVNAQEMSITRKTGEYFSFSIDLDPISCNINFFPEGQYEIAIVREGSLIDGYGEHSCEEFELFQPCGVSKSDVQMSCRGRYEIIDEDGNEALIVHLEVEAPPVINKTYLGIGISVALTLLSSCCGCCRVCCKNSSSEEEEKETTESPDAEPARNIYHEYDHEPVGLQQAEFNQPSETLYPALPSYTQTGPQIHNPPTVNVPAAHFKVSAPGESTDDPTVPLSSDPEPKFELSFATDLPLSSDTLPDCDVYTSDKLNF